MSELTTTVKASAWVIPGLIKRSLQERIEDLFELPQGDLFNRTREADYVIARHMYVALFREFFCPSPTRLVRRIPGRFEHAMVYHSCKTCANLIDTDKDFREKYELIKSELQYGLIRS